MVPEPLEKFLEEVARDTWELFQKHALVLVLASLLVLIVSALSLGLLAGPLLVGFLDMVRRARAGEPLQTGDAFKRFDSFLASLIALVLIGCAVSIGMFLLVAPGLLVAIFSAFTLHAIAYERVTAIAAIKRSVEIVKANFVHALVLLLLISVAQTIGGAVLLGTIITLPLGLVASALGFERMVGRQQAIVAGQGYSTP
jgi:hypothetical protein